MLVMKDRSEEEGKEGGFGEKRREEGEKDGIYELFEEE